MIKKMLTNIKLCIYDIDSIVKFDYFSPKSFYIMEKNKLGNIFSEGEPIKPISSVYAIVDTPIIFYHIDKELNLCEEDIINILKSVRYNNIIFNEFGVSNVEINLKYYHKMYNIEIIECNYVYKY